MNKILIVDENSDFRIICSEMLKRRGYEILPDASDGEDAVNKIQKYSPDIVIIDLWIQKRNAATVMNYFKKELGLSKPNFIAISGINNKYVERDAISNGADRFLLKPFNESQLINYVKEISGQQAYNIEVTASEDDLEVQVTKMMHKIGMPAHLKGYEYTRRAIMMAVYNKGIINAITKKLYPSIAEMYETTSSRVERAIRHAIELGWTRGDYDAINDIFGYTIQQSRGKPTNSEFIAMISDKLRLQNKNLLDT